MAAITRMEVVEGDSVAVCRAMLRYSQKAAGRTGEELKGSKEKKVTPSSWLERLHSWWNDCLCLEEAWGASDFIESKNSRAQE